MAAKDRGSGENATRNILRSAGAFLEAVPDWFRLFVFGTLSLLLHGGEVRARVSPRSTTHYSVEKPPFAVIPNRQYRRSISIWANTEPLFLAINAIGYDPCARHKTKDISVWRKRIQLGLLVVMLIVAVVVLVTGKMKIIDPAGLSHNPLLYLVLLDPIHICSCRQECKENGSA
jgi:hypothetical protein